MPHAYAEIVQFRLVPEASIESYLSASEPSRRWYQKQPGYLNSEIIAGPDGLWLGIIRWENAEAAEGAAARSMTELDMSPVMGMIDTESVRMLSGEIVARDA